jgi:HAD superfamily hydrolase (TIGR01490 family)
MTSPRRLKKFAIFDIDGTIFRSSLLIEVTEALIEAGTFPVSVRKRYDREYKSWLNRKGSYDDYIDGVVRVFQDHIKGVHFEDFLKVAQKVVAGHKDRTYRYTRDLVKELKKKGYFLLAISKSPKGIVERFAKNLGFDKVYGMLYETDKNEKYTGKIMFYDLMADKAKVLNRAVDKEGLTLRGSVGVGDTESDIAFLKIVDRPICFNPNRKLYDHACRVGWEIVAERKDVIYKIGGKGKGR